MNFHHYITAGLLTVASAMLIADPIRFAGPVGWLLAGYAVGLLHIVEKLWQWKQKINL